MSRDKWNVLQQSLKCCTTRRRGGRFEIKMQKNKAQAEVHSLIKQYDEILHKNWDMTTKEQRNRIELLKVQTEKMQENMGSEKEVIDDWVAAVMEEEKNNE